VFFLLAQNINAQDSTIINLDKNHADRFGKIFVQDNNGRVKPLNTLCNELLRKLSRKESLNGLDANQVILGMIFNPEYWQTQDLIKISNPELMKLIGADKKVVPFNLFIDEKTGKYKLKELLDKAFEKTPGLRDKYDKDIIAVDERVNLAYQVFTGKFLKVFPMPEQVNHPWVIPSETNMMPESEDSKYATYAFYNYYYAVLASQKTGDWKTPNLMVDSILTFQKKYGKEIILSDFKKNLEIFYVNSDIFSLIFKLYGIVGFTFLIVLFVGILKPKIKLNKLIKLLMVLLGAIFLLHAAGLAILWYISGHAPWSNGYETMIFVSWAAMLAGFLFAKRSQIVLAVASILATIALMVANLSYMDPQITNLVPVLKSYWLSIHVSVITSSYGFLGIGALLGLLNLLIMVFRNNENKDVLESTLEELTIINHMVLIIGIYLLSIGTFLGAVWANESWGRYWGWDPKETWALISIIVYTIVSHSRLIPGMNNKYTFNLLSLLGFSSILMTFFGVNYYLSGMHSYAQGEPMPIPIGVYIAIAAVFVIAILAYMKNSKLEVNKSVNSDNAKLE